MFDIIYNPKASNGKSQASLDYVCKTLDSKSISYTLYPTEYAGHATELTKTINQKPQSELLILGGDGTYNEVLNGITNFDTITLGFIPCGTGNDFIKAINVPMNTEKALDIILSNKRRKADFIQINDGRCLNCAGAGMDVDVLERYATMKAFKGKLKYYASLIDVLLHLRFHKAQITVDGKTSLHNVFLITVANGIYIGGGMPISPKSTPFDGLLDVVLVNEIKPSKVLSLLLKFLKGKHIYEPCAELFSGKEVSITILDEGKIQIDGEVKEEKTLDCKLIEGKLNIFCE